MHTFLYYIFQGREKKINIWYFQCKVPCRLNELFSIGLHPILLKKYDLNFAQNKENHSIITQITKFYQYHEWHSPV